jgi:hypothetical protein
VLEAGTIISEFETVELGADTDKEAGIIVSKLEAVVLGVELSN